jgi:thiosulfate reductase cytochrome b subunit
MSGVRASASLSGRRRPIHPLVIRVTHWVNAIATIVMIGSGWQIYNASPLFAFAFPPAMTIGGWLGGALLWHFAAMWLLALNGLVYLVYFFASGRYRRLLPLSPASVWRDLMAAYRGILSHADLSAYNAVQRAAYAGALVVLVVLVMSGLALWKPVQLQGLAWCFGGYEGARYVHFVAMALLVLFVVVHVAMAVLVPRSLLAMITGRAARTP